MITCKSCSSIIGTLEESTELHVIGEIRLNLICPNCKKITTEMLFEYDLERVTYQLVDKENVTNLLKLGRRY